MQNAWLQYFPPWKSIENHIVANCVCLFFLNHLTTQYATNKHQKSNKILTSFEALYHGSQDIRVERESGNISLQIWLKVETTPQIHNLKN